MPCSRGARPTSRFVFREIIVKLRPGHVSLPSSLSKNKLSYPAVTRRLPLLVAHTARTVFFAIPLNSSLPSTILYQRSLRYPCFGRLGETIGVRQKIGGSESFGFRNICRIGPWADPITQIALIYGRGPVAKGASRDICC